MKKTRRKFTAAFKAQVAIEALKKRETLAALSARSDDGITLYKAINHGIEKYNHNHIKASAETSPLACIK